jgi:hypothetical protein
VRVSLWDKVAVDRDHSNGRLLPVVKGRRVLLRIDENEPQQLAELSKRLQSPLMRRTIAARLSRPGRASCCIRIRRRSCRTLPRPAGVLASCGAPVALAETCTAFAFATCFGESICTPMVFKVSEFVARLVNQMQPGVNRPLIHLEYLRRVVEGVGGARGKKVGQVG